MTIRAFPVVLALALGSLSGRIASADARYHVPAPSDPRLVVHGCAYDRQSQDVHCIVENRATEVIAALRYAQLVATDPETGWDSPLGGSGAIDFVPGLAPGQVAAVRVPRDWVGTDTDPETLSYRLLGLTGRDSRGELIEGSPTR
jgi:hypothetical protein